MRRFLAWWFGGVAVVAVTTYAVWAVQVSRWIEYRLAPAQITATAFCWSARDSAARRAAIAASEDRRDAIVERVVVMAPHEFGGSHIQWQLHWIGIDHVYRTWWSSADRQQAFAYVAPRMRACHSPASSQA